MKYISGKQITDQYGIQDIELFELVTKQGLQPQDKLGKLLPDPILREFDVAIKEIVQKIDAIKLYMPKSLGLRADD